MFPKDFIHHYLPYKSTNPRGFPKIRMMNLCLYDFIIPILYPYIYILPLLPPFLPLFFQKHLSLSLYIRYIYIYIFMTLRHHPLLLNRPLFLSASACQVLGVNEVKTLDATALSEEIQKATTLELRLWPGEEMTGGKRTKQRNVWGTQKTWRTKGFLIRAFIKGKQWLGKNI